MAPGVLVVPPAVAVADADRLARRRRACLVAVRGPHGWGAATPDTLRHARRLGLRSAPIDALLWDTPAVPPVMTEVDVRRRLGPGQPFVLVSDSRRPLGAILRDSAAPTTLALTVGDRLAALGPAVVDLLRRVGALGEALGMPVALVGGPVRDLLLGRTGRPPDLDLAVEGDAATVARRLAAELGGRVVEHGAFRTATLDLPGGPRLDLATARRERYPAPGALPQVEPASLGEDLGRRDFSVNAMAIRLGPDAWGALVDPTGGLVDLRARRIRILHPLAFVEDPTRIFRAARLAARLGCRIDPGTRRLARAAAALDCYPALSGDRLRGELALLLAEPRPGAALAEATRLGTWRLLGPPPADAAAAVRRATGALALARRAPLAPDTATALLVLALTQGRPAADAWAGRLALPPTARDALRRARADGPALLVQLRRARDPARAYAILRGTAEVSLAWARLLARGARARRYLEAYLRRWRRLRPLATGDDIQRLGVPPGPAVGALLRGLLAAQAAGGVRSRPAALRWLRAAVMRDSRRTAHPTG
jgi:tRNA nucleotidyltransferase (CCA-adding enzyme)